MRSLIVILTLLTCATGLGWTEQRYKVSAMVVKVDAEHGSFIASCQSIRGYMEAMTMPFEAREVRELEGLEPGMNIEFALVVDNSTSYAEHIQVHRYESVEQDPLTARRLKLLTQLSHSSAHGLNVGQTVPDFVLTDQNRRQVALSQFAGKIVAINFIYTSCALPNYCYRITNNFGALQRRFQEQLGRDLILLTITFDPQRDGTDALANYAKKWKADPETWRFLTGTVPDIQRVTNLFGVDYFPDEGLMNHSLHTAVIDRQGRLIANIEGNQFTADQLGDLVQTALTQPSRGDQRTLTHSLNPHGGLSAN